MAELDFNEVDQTIQVHGEYISSIVDEAINRSRLSDYAGVGLSSRDANSKAAANEATNIFQSHYPEFLVCTFWLLSFRHTLITY